MPTMWMVQVLNDRCFQIGRKARDRMWVGVGMSGSEFKRKPV